MGTRLNVTTLQPLETFNESLDSMEGLLSHHTFGIGEYYVLLPLRTCFCVMGIVLNGLTIRAFYRIGIEDSVTVVLFVQAILDFLILAWSLNLTVFSTLGFAERDWDVVLLFSPLSVTVFTATIIRMLLDTTCTLTTFLAVQRCLCVALPLQFKGLFTRRRTVIILASIFIFHGVFYILLLATYQFKWKVIPPKNYSQHVLVFKPSRAFWAIFINFMFSVVINTVSQIIVTVCVIFMANVLIKSVRFRLKSSSTTSGSKHMGDGFSESKNGSSYASSATTTALEDTKELLVIKQVALVCTIYMTCNIPRFCYSFARFIEPEFDIAGRYVLLYRLCYSIKIFFEFVNSSLNFFVYYNHNDSFKKACFGADIKMRRGKINKL